MVSLKTKDKTNQKQKLYKNTKNLPKKYHFFNNNLNYVI